MADFAFEYWERIDELRGNKTLSELSKVMGIKEQSLRNMKSENRYPKLEATQRLASFLGTTVEYLMTGKEPEKAQVNDDYTYITKMLKDDPTLASSIANLIKSIKGEK